MFRKQSWKNLKVLCCGYQFKRRQTWLRGPITHQVDKEIEETMSLARTGEVTCIHLGRRGCLLRECYDMRCENRKKAVMPTPQCHTPKATALSGTWNVRIMYKAGKTAHIADTMNADNLSILGLCETR